MPSRVWYLEGGAAVLLESKKTFGQEWWPQRWRQEGQEFKTSFS